MDDKKISVTLTGPAKIDGVREPQGKTVTVTTALALQLAASGVINPVQFDEAETLSADFDAAIAGAVADREANWATALDHFDTMAEDRIAEATTARDEALSRVTELEAALATATAALSAQRTPEKKARS